MTPSYCKCQVTPCSMDKYIKLISFDIFTNILELCQLSKKQLISTQIQNHFNQNNFSMNILLTSIFRHRMRGYPQRKFILKLSRLHILFHFLIKTTTIPFVCEIEDSCGAKLSSLSVSYFHN